MRRRSWRRRGGGRAAGDSDGVSVGPFIDGRGLDQGVMGSGVCGLGW